MIGPGLRLPSYRDNFVPSSLVLHARANPLKSNDFPATTKC